MAYHYQPSDQLTTSSTSVFSAKPERLIIRLPARARTRQTAQELVAVAESHSGRSYAGLPRRWPQTRPSFSCTSPSPSTMPPNGVAGHGIPSLKLRLRVPTGLRMARAMNKLAVTVSS